MPGKYKWGDQDDDIDEGDSTSIIESEPDKDGVKTIVSFSTNAKGQRIKVTRKVKVYKKTKTVSKDVIRRRNFKKFGEAAKKDGDDGVTNVGDEVFVVPTRKQAEEASQAKAETSTFSLNITCQVCGKQGDHWTSKCPYKDQLEPGQFSLPGVGNKGDAPPSSTGKYIPPNRHRSPQDLAELRAKEQITTVRVSNLSEDTRDSDLAELFRPFGPVTRLYLAKDKHTGSSRGFAFVTFVHRRDAESAIKALNGFGYDHLILNCSFAHPRLNY